MHEQGVENMALSRVFYLVATVFLLGLLAVPVLAYDTVEQIPADNPTCVVCGCNNVLTIDGGQLAAGKYQLGSTGKYVTISNIQTKSGGEIIGFSWTSETPIECVIVKASNGANKFGYNTPATSDSEILWTYDHFGTGKEYAISHVYFCSHSKTIEVPEFPIMAVPLLFIIGFGIVMIHLGRKKE